MATYCIWQSAATYGPRDEITGSRAHKVQCFKKLAVAKKRAKKLAKDDGDSEVWTELCRGAVYCGHNRNGKHKIRRKKRQKPSTSKARRAKRRQHLDPNWIPF
jgi:hypothetical protein